MGEQRLLLVQIDDRSGEELREGLEGLMDAGVRNYQVLSSLTKKGRPGFVLLLDLDSDIEGEVMTYLSEFHRDGGTVVVVTHEELAEQHAQRTIHLTSGRIEGD